VIAVASLPSVTAPSRRRAVATGRVHERGGDGVAAPLQALDQIRKPLNNLSRAASRRSRGPFTLH
jgi:hypothetical protein